MSHPPFHKLEVPVKNISISIENCSTKCSIPNPRRDRSAAAAGGANHSRGLPFLNPLCAAAFCSRCFLSIIKLHMFEPDTGTLQRTWFNDKVVLHDIGYANPEFIIYFHRLFCYFVFCRDSPIYLRQLLIFDMPFKSFSTKVIFGFNLIKTYNFN